ncbi:MAG: gluconokinase, partial [Calditrichia bacterium]
MIIILTGVSGSGKSTVGKLLAKETGWPFYEGDDYHSPANIDKMEKGIPLTDKDRQAWLESLEKLITELDARGKNAVISSSALKEDYREFLKGQGREVNFVFLKGDFDLIKERLKKRKNHFFNKDLLESQFRALEEPHRDLAVDI